MNHKNKLLISAFTTIAFLILLHQYVNWGTWFTIEDIHHETFALMFLFGAGVVCYIGYKKARKKGKN